MENRKALSRAVLAIALPLALQSLLGYAVNLVDTVMIGQLGTTGLAAVSQANQIFFIASMAIPGIADGANVLISQAWGNGNKERIHKVLAYTYRTALAFILILMLLTALFPQQIMGIYTKDPQAIELGSRYLRIVVWSYLFYALSNTTIGILRSVRTVKIAMYSSAISLTVKIIINFLLIEGNMGFPALGIEGAALATLLARIGEFILVMIFIYLKEDKLVVRINKMKKLDKSLLKPYYATSIPVICNELFWAFGASAQAIVLGRMGTDVVAANSISGAITQITAVLCHAVASAACVVIGNTIGAEEYDLIPRLKKYFQKFSFTLGIISSTLVILAIPLVPLIYDVDGVTMQYCRELMIITACILPFQSLQATNMMGLLRGGGDVKFQMANDMLFLWGLTVPLGFVSAFVLKAPVVIVYICLKCDQVIKAFTSEWRLRSKKWIHNMNA